MKATKQEVANAAMLILKGSPRNQVTSREVKSLLSILGFEILNNEASSMLESVAKDLCLDFSVITEGSSTFRVYGAVTPKTTNGFQYR